MYRAATACWAKPLKRDFESLRGEFPRRYLSAQVGGANGIRQDWFELRRTRYYPASKSNYQGQFKARSDQWQGVRKVSQGLGRCTRAGSGGKCSQGGRGSAWRVGWRCFGGDLEGERHGRSAPYVIMCRYGHVPILIQPHSCVFGRSLYSIV
jgi:hypothetical protein